MRCRCRDNKLAVSFSLVLRLQPTGFGLLVHVWYCKVPVSCCSGFSCPTSFYRREKSSSAISFSVTHARHMCVWPHLTCHPFQRIHFLCLIVHRRFAHLMFFYAGVHVFIAHPGQEKVVVDGGDGGSVGWWWWLGVLRNRGCCSH